MIESVLISEPEFLINIRCLAYPLQCSHWTSISHHFCMHMQILGLCKDPDGQGVFSAHEEAMQVTTALGGPQQSQIGENENDHLRMRVKQLENVIIKYKVWCYQDTVKRLLYQ